MRFYALCTVMLWLMACMILFEIHNVMIPDSLFYGVAFSILFMPIVIGKGKR